VGSVVGTLAFASLAVPQSAMAAPGSTTSDQPTKPKYKVCLCIIVPEVTLAEDFRIFGTVSLPARALKDGKSVRGKRVKVQRYAEGDWRTVATPRLTKRARYSTVLNSGDLVRSYRYRVVKPRSKGVRMGASKPMRVTVVEPLPSSTP
jgi:hypothetical protein